MERESNIFEKFFSKFSSVYPHTLGFYPVNSIMPRGPKYIIVV